MVSSALVGNPVMEQMCQYFGLDYLRFDNDRSLRVLNPDLVTENSERREENHWGPQVEWSIKGKRYAVVLCPKVRTRKLPALKFLWVEVLPALTTHVLDERVMLEDLAEHIQSTLNS